MITKVEVRIENESATISATKTFDDSANEEINVVSKRIKTSRFISSKIEFVTEFESAEIIEDTEIIEDAEIIESAEVIKGVKVIEEFESESDR
jgi:hypothetical protein